MENYNILNLSPSNEMYRLFPNFILDKGIISEGGTIAWNKNNIFEAIEEVAKLNYAILGGDVWALKINDISCSNKKINYCNIYVGIIPLNNGSETVCNWSFNKKLNENWSDFVLRSKVETIKYINEANIEKRVKDELKDKIYYNLVFSNELDFAKAIFDVDVTKRYSWLNSQLNTFAVANKIDAIEKQRLQRLVNDMLGRAN